MVTLTNAPVQVTGLCKMFRTRGAAPHALVLLSWSARCSTLRMIPAREDSTIRLCSSTGATPSGVLIEECPGGVVLVIDRRKDIRGGSLGDILIACSMERGGRWRGRRWRAARHAQIEPLAFPVYSGGPAAPASFGIHHAVDLDQLIGCGDVAVFPGDALSAAPKARR